MADASELRLLVFGRIFSAHLLDPGWIQLDPGWIQVDPGRPSSGPIKNGSKTGRVKPVFRL